MASLKQIAAELGVSYTLVSKVLSGKLGTTGVSEETRGAILRKAAEMDYKPNRLAVALKSGRKGALGVFVHRFGTPGSEISYRLLGGIAEGMDECGYRMWLRFFTTDEEFRAACDRKLEGEIDGLIVAGVDHPGLIDKFKEMDRSGLPVVCVLSHVSETKRPIMNDVGADHDMQGYLATTHLLDQGCKRLATLVAVDTRHDGFLRAHRERRIKADPKLVIPTNDRFELTDGEKGMRKLLSLRIPFDGLFCHSDSLAVGAINEMIRRGIKVPDSVKVVGVDDSPLADACIVPITSVSSGMEQAGREAVKLVLRKIAGEPLKSVSIETKLVVRASSARSS